MRLVVAHYERDLVVIVVRVRVHRRGSHQVLWEAFRAVVDGKIEDLEPVLHYKENDDCGSD